MPVFPSIVTGHQLLVDDDQLCHVNGDHVLLGLMLFCWIYCDSHDSFMRYRFFPIADYIYILWMLMHVIERWCGQCYRNPTELFHLYFGNHIIARVLKQQYKHEKISVNHKIVCKLLVIYRTYTAGGMIIFAWSWSFETFHTAVISDQPLIFRNNRSEHGFLQCMPYMTS